MKKNNLYTKSYFIKRLKDSGFYIREECIMYHKSDTRQWTIVIGDEMILCTCYKIDPTQYWFKFDSQQKSNVLVSTLSMETIFHTVRDLENGSMVYSELKDKAKNGI